MPGRTQLTYSSADCPLDRQSVEEYLDHEDRHNHHDTLHFICRADCEDRQYWIWCYHASLGVPSYLVISKKPDTNQIADIYLNCNKVSPPGAPLEELVEELLSQEA
ncbi:hypothetical protein [Parachitinimonas caeni]|uniref:Uncharacterized protein n=1 Tax=Parachitinimonas caeni TaxID=3031301 RepID=A0ABT7DVN9_9NEIS|nr:hypothetical protein [Parachitinimonas caeni]MDK2123909.1 hypothetical protein [Parachitinimonas caeni]